MSTVAGQHTTQQTIRHICSGARLQCRCVCVHVRYTHDCVNMYSACTEVLGSCQINGNLCQIGLGRVGYWIILRCAPATTFIYSYNCICVCAHIHEREAHLRLRLAATLAVLESSCILVSMGVVSSADRGNESVVSGSKRTRKIHCVIRDNATNW